MTKSNLLFLLTALCLIQSACKSDDDMSNPSNIEFSNCLASEIVQSNLVNNWCTENTIGSTDVCEIIEIETPFRLSEDDKAWQPFYCLGIGEAVHYHNEAGDQTSLVITSKNYNEGYTAQTQLNCPSNDTLRTQYCFTVETARVSVVSEVLGFEMTINLSPLIDLVHIDSIQSGTQIQITSLQQNPLVFSTHFSAIVDNGDLENSPSSNFNVNFYEEISVLNQTFTNVYTYENTFSDFIPILFNKDYGIVSFIDESGKKWVINK